MIILYIIIGWSLFGTLTAIITCKIEKDVLNVKDLLICCFLGVISLFGYIAVKLRESIKWNKIILDCRKKEEN